MKKELTQKLAKKLKDFPLEGKVSIMEVCGTHTTEYLRSGLRDLFPANLHLVDGPGCPVCVTPNEYLDRAIEIGREHHAILATFGDMIKVPSSYSSLSQERADGMDIRVVYSPLNALEVAKDNPDKEVVFLSVGFETTAPTEAVAVIEAKKQRITNFSILPGNKLTPPAVDALLGMGEVNIDGFILPGHVSAIVGEKAWRFIGEKYGKPGVVTGFHTDELITGTLALLTQIKDMKSDTKNEYTSVVKEDGNQRAVEMMYKVFVPADSEWRGIGIIPGSGLDIREEYRYYDASLKFPVHPPEPKEAPGCRCGELLRGLIQPPECPLYGKECTPERPIGPCMVSSEGPCAAYYKYWSGE